MQSREAVTDYERDGCIRVRGFLDANLLQDVRRRLDHYMREIAPAVPEGDRTFEPDGVTVRNLWRMEQHDPYFVDFAKRPAVIDSFSGGPRLIVICRLSNRRSSRIGSG